MVFDDTTRRRALQLLGAGAGIATIGTGSATAQPHAGLVLESKRMVGNELTGAAGAIRGIDAGGLPWAVEKARARLDGDGRLTVAVRGLVIDPDAEAPAAGTNPIPRFRAILSCLAPDGTVHTLPTETAPASADGDARIADRLDLPDPCLAPVVFVAGPAELLGSDLWFAVTGV